MTWREFASHLAEPRTHADFLALEHAAMGHEAWMERERRQAVAYLASAPRRRARSVLRAEYQRARAARAAAVGA